MDLRSYFSKVHAIERNLVEDFVVIVSNETSDGGKPGALSEVPRRLAATMMVDLRARLATEEEARQYRRLTSGKTDEAAPGPPRPQDEE